MRNEKSFPTLQDIQSLNDEEKAALKGYIKTVINEISTKNGTLENEFSLEIENTKKHNISLMASPNTSNAKQDGNRDKSDKTKEKNKNTSEKSKASNKQYYEERIKALGLDSNVENNVLKEFKKGDISQNQVKKILSANNTYEINRLTSEQQDKTIKNILENNRKQTSRNAEEVALHAIKNNNFDEHLAEYWYNSTRHSAEKLLERLDVYENAVGLLTDSRRFHLLDTLTQLNNKLNNTIKKS